MPTSNGTHAVFVLFCAIFLFCGIFQVMIWIGPYHWCFITLAAMYCKSCGRELLLDTKHPLRVLLLIGCFVIYQVIMGIDYVLIDYIHLFISGWGILQLGTWLSESENTYACLFLVCCGIFRVAIWVKPSASAPGIIETCPTYDFTDASTAAQGEPFIRFFVFTLNIWQSSGLLRWSYFDICCHFINVNCMLMLHPYGAILQPTWLDACL